MNHLSPECSCCFLIYLQGIRWQANCNVSELVCVYLRVHSCVCVSQGVVCTLHEGDDFGKLALVTDSPRAASIVLREDNCHFLRVDKEDFNRILRVGRRDGHLSWWDTNVVHMQQTTNFGTIKSHCRRSSSTYIQHNEVRSIKWNAIWMHDFGPSWLWCLSPSSGRGAAVHLQ